MVCGSRVIKDPYKVCLLNCSHYKLSAGLWKNSNILVSWLLWNLRHIFLTMFFKTIFIWVYLNTIKSMYPKLNSLSLLHLFFFFLFCFSYSLNKLLPWLKTHSSPKKFQKNLLTSLLLHLPPNPVHYQIDAIFSLCTFLVLICIFLFILNYYCHF